MNTRKILTGIVPSFWEVRNIIHDGLGLNEKKVKPKLSTTLVIRLYDQGFSSLVENIQHCTTIEIGHVQMHLIPQSDHDISQLGKLG